MKLIPIRKIKLIPIAVLGLAAIAVPARYAMTKWEAAAIAAAAPSTGEPPGPAKSLAGSHNAFGFDLFSRVAVSHPGENVLLSPLGVAMALAMIENGASGRTSAEIAGALRLSDASLRDLGPAERQLMSDLTPRLFMGGIVDPR